MNLDIFFRQFARPGMTALDVGAHEGVISEVLSLAVGSNGRVVAFEPNPQKFKILVEKKLPRVACEPVAVADREGVAQLFCGEAEFADQASTIVERLGNQQRLGSKIKTISVPVTTIDDYATKHKLIPDLIKIDVEGAESLVLRGARRVIEQFRPMIIFEQGSEIGAPTPETLKDLRTKNYVFRICDLILFLDSTRGWQAGNTLNSLRGPLIDKLISFEWSQMNSHSVLANIAAFPREKWDDNRLPSVSWDLGLTRLQPSPRPGLRSQAVKTLRSIYRRTQAYLNRA